eukprot:2261174-Amphidinium_carterae.1
MAASIQLDAANYSSYFTGHKTLFVLSRTILAFYCFSVGFHARDLAFCSIAMDCHSSPYLSQSTFRYRTTTCTHNRAHMASQKNDMSWMKELSKANEEGNFQNKSALGTR